MEKVWFVKISDAIEGPYSKKDLKIDKRLTPDTLVWRKGYAAWVPIRNVPELEDLFEEEEPKKETEEESKIVSIPEEELALSRQIEPPPLIFWLLLAALFAAYLIYVQFS